jgi:transcriptional regulator with XRE-family HTH domain
MAKKSSPVKRPTPGTAWRVGRLPAEPTVIPGPGMMEDVRKRVGLSQKALAEEVGVSRDVIANYELGRTNLDSVEDCLKVWRVLEVKERALNIPQEKGSPSAAEAVLGLLWFAKESAQKHVAEIEGQINNLQRKRETIRRQIAEIESELADRKVMLAEKSNGRSA